MFGVPGPLGAKLGNFELGGGGPMYAIVYPAMFKEGCALLPRGKRGHVFIEGCQK